MGDAHVPTCYVESCESAYTAYLQLQRPTVLFTDLGSQIPMSIFCETQVLVKCVLGQVSGAIWTVRAKSNLILI